MNDGYVIDASALLALMRSEPGGDKVAPHVEQGLMSIVNLAEVAGYFVKAGAARVDVERQLRGSLPQLVEPSKSQALDAAALIPHTRSAGLSLGDRFCLALALAERRPVLTADRAWARLAIEDVRIELIR